MEQEEDDEEGFEEAKMLTTNQKLMMEEAKKSKVDHPNYGKAEPLEEAKKNNTEKVSSMSNSVMESYYKDDD